MKFNNMCADAMGRLQGESANQTESKGSVENKEDIHMKKLVSLVLALMLCLSCVSALAAEAWTVTCPWAPSGVAAMVNQKAAALSTTYSNDYVIVANAEKGDTATINSWLTKFTEA